MIKQAEKLTFYCQLCDQSIDTNICPQHGIDFVTIKKVSHIQKNHRQAPEEERRVNGMLQLEGNNNAAGSSSPETQLATPEQIRKQAHLPVIPTDSEEQETLKPVPAAKVTPDTLGEQYENPLSDSIKNDLNVQLNDYQEADFEANEYYEYARATQSQTQSNPIAKKGVIIGSAVFVALLSLFVVFFSMKQSTPSSTSLYTQAESYYENQNYKEALPLYIQFVERFPDDPLLPVVSERIDILTQQMAQANDEEIDDQTRIKNLMIKANVALQKHQYVKPRGNNAIAYAAAVLKIDPNYQPALEMYENVISHFTNMAEEALQQGKYNDAIIYYQTVLEIKPNDAEIIGRIHSILTQKDELIRQ